MSGNPAYTLMNTIENAKKFLSQVEGAEGFNLPDDKKEEFKAEMKKKGFEEMKTKLDAELEKLKTIGNKWKPNGKSN